jgi:hypothetical protein
MKNENELRNIAQKVIDNTNIPKDVEFLQDQEDNHGSIILTIMLISVIIGAIRVMQECNKNSIIGNRREFYGKEIKNLSVRRGWYTKMRIKKLLRQNNCNKQLYKQYGNDIVTAILDVAENLKEDEIKILLEAADV